MTKGQTNYTLISFKNLIKIKFFRVFSCTLVLILSVSLTQGGSILPA